MPVFSLRSQCLSGEAYAFAPKTVLASIPPALMPHRKPVQHFALESPGRHEPVHQRGETAVVRAFQQVRHFVDQYVFQTFGRFLLEIGI